MALDISAIRTTIATPAAESPRRAPTLGLHRRVRGKALAAATRQLAVMLGAGLPVVHSLQLLIEQAESGPLRRTLRDVARRVEAGSSLGRRSRLRMPDVFPPLYVALVRTGELGGVLEAVLHRLAAYLEQSARLRRTVVGALAYPAVVVSAALIVTAVLLGWVVPVFAGVFASMGAELPAPTRLVLALSSAFRRTPRPARRRRPGHRRDDRGRRTQRARPADPRPVAAASPGHRRPCSLKAAVARTARTLGTLIACGVAILDALDVAARTAGNRVVEDAFVQRGRRTRARAIAGAAAWRSVRRSPRWSGR